jgi:hypothetical protein
MHFLHRRLLPAEKWKWYRVDVLYPLIAALVVLLPAYLPISSIDTNVGLVMAVGFAWLMTQFLVAVATPLGRDTLAALNRRVRAA